MFYNFNNIYPHPILAFKLHPPAWQPTSNGVCRLANQPLQKVLDGVHFSNSVFTSHSYYRRIYFLYQSPSHVYNQVACYRIERTLMGCADLPSKGVGAPHQCPLEFTENRVVGGRAGSDGQRRVTASTSLLAVTGRQCTSCPVVVDID